MITPGTLRGLSQVADCFNLNTRGIEGDKRFYALVEILNVLLPALGYSVDTYYRGAYNECQIKLKENDLKIIYGDYNETNNAI